MSKAMTEFDQWVVCPKCITAMVGEIGEKCFLCKTEMVATPLFPDDNPDIEPRYEALLQKTPYSARITAKVRHDAGLNARDIPSNEAICAELGLEYTPEDLEVLNELGL